MKLNNSSLLKLVKDNGGLIANYNIKNDQLTDRVNSTDRKDLQYVRETLFNEVGYYFILDEDRTKVLMVTSIGDQLGANGFNDRISRIRRRATKVNRAIVDNHDIIRIFFVHPSKIKYILDPAEKWVTKFKKLKKTERNTILENTRFIKLNFELII